MNKTNNIKRLKDRKRGFATLENINQNCYMNCIIQCLSNDYRFCHFLRKQKTNLNDQDSESSDNEYDEFFASTLYNEQNKIFINFSNLLREMWRKNLNYIPNTFYRNFLKKYPYYLPNQQHDARDFLFDLLNEMHISLEKKCVEIETSKHSSRHFLNSLKEWRSYFDNKKSYISDNFYGQYIKSFTCQLCGNCYYKYDPFLMITIDNKDGNITDLINESMMLDVINGECEKCKTENIIDEDTPDYLKNIEHLVDTSIYKLPNTLIVCIKSINKTLTPMVKISETLDLYKKVISNTDESVEYQLDSIVYHQGHSIENGHYYMVSLRNDEYNLFNDNEKINNIDIKEIKDNPYLIFYSKMKSK